LRILSNQGKLLPRDLFFKIKGEFENFKKDLDYYSVEKPLFCKPDKIEYYLIVAELCVFKKNVVDPFSSAETFASSVLNKSVHKIQMGSYEIKKNDKKLLYLIVSEFWKIIRKHNINEKTLSANNMYEIIKICENNES